jgi:hypothetical protein
MILLSHVSLSAIALSWAVRPVNGPSAERSV